MEYKLISVLKTRHVEPWAEYVYGENVNDKPQPGASASVVRQAVKCGWFDGTPPDADDMEPKDVVALATMIYRAYAAAMGVPLKNLHERSSDTPKE